MTSYPSYNPVNKPFAPVPIYWTGASGTKYTFQLDAFNAISYYAIGGVYIFCRPISASSYSAIYVGETDSFWRRLTNEFEAHHALPAIRLHGATHISTLSVPGDRANRLYIETDLRNALNPACNKQ